ncbi:hypothetical protein, partial [Streptomyces sp. NPDC002845]
RHTPCGIDMPIFPGQRSIVATRLSTNCGTRATTRAANSRTRGSSVSSWSSGQGLAGSLATEIVGIDHDYFRFHQLRGGAAGHCAG